MPQDRESFFRCVYADNDGRVSGRRDFQNDQRLWELNESLREEERELLEDSYSEAFPVVFVVGVPRSGTTLLTQLMIDHLRVGYVNNHVARYWMAPVYGMRDYLDRYDTGAADAGRESFLGNTVGPHAPSEFGWFWQWWFGHVAHDQLDEKELDRLLWRDVARELYGLASLLQRPLLLKALVYIDFKVARVAREFVNCRFIWLRRDPLYTCQSLLESRQKRYGSTSTWWSVRPANVAELRRLGPEEQVVQQWQAIEDALTEQFADVDPSQRLVMDYEDLVAAPGRALARVGKLLGLPVEGSVPVELQSANRQRLPREVFVRLRSVVGSVLG